MWWCCPVGVVGGVGDRGDMGEGGGSDEDGVLQTGPCLSGSSVIKDV